MNPLFPSARWTWRCLAVAMGLALAIMPMADAQRYRPEKERRSLSLEEFELVVQKDGRIDFRTTEGWPLLDNGAPALIGPDGEVRPLKVDARLSKRISLNTPLGRGNGFVFTSENFEWRVGTYPVSGVVTFDVTYINSGRKPIQIGGLMPLQTGAAGEGGLALDPTDAPLVVLRPHTTPQQATSDHVTASSPTTGWTATLGFLNHGARANQIAEIVGVDAENIGLYRIASECAPGQPLTIEPGGKWIADTVYLRLGRVEPAQALEDYVAAVEAMEPFPSVSTRHGWWPDHFDGPAQQAALAAMDPALIASGWNGVFLGSLEPPLLSESAASVVEGARARGLTVSAETQIINSAIDEYINQLKAMRLDRFVPRLTESNNDSLECRAWALDLRAMIDGATSARPLIHFARPRSTAPQSLLDWAEAGRNWYLPAEGNPCLASGVPELRQDPTGLSDSQFITAFSLVALQGRPLRPTLPWNAMSALQRHVLERVLPAPSRGARPLDLLEDGPPKVWHLPLRTEAGDWTLAGLFNWDPQAPAEHHIPLTRLGLNNDNIYTVYDFWSGQYLGLIENTLRVEVPPEGVRIIGLRRYERRPMLVASDRHYTQGASDHTALGWDHDRATLSGTVKLIPGRRTTLTVLVPEPYRVREVQSAATVAARSQAGPVLTFGLDPVATGEATWTVTFDGGGATTPAAAP